MLWSDEKIDLLKVLWAQGKSASEIADVIGDGVSRNAIIGKAHRLGLVGRPSPIKKKVEKLTTLNMLNERMCNLTLSHSANPSMPDIREVSRSSLWAELLPYICGINY